MSIRETHRPLHLRVDRIAHSAKVIFGANKISDWQPGTLRRGRNVPLFHPSAQVVRADESSTPHHLGMIEQNSPNGMGSRLKASHEVLVFTAILFRHIL